MLACICTSRIAHFIDLRDPLRSSAASSGPLAARDTAITSSSVTASASALSTARTIERCALMLKTVKMSRRFSSVGMWRSRSISQPLRSAGGAPPVDSSCSDSSSAGSARNRTSSPLPTSVRPRCVHGSRGFAETVASSASSIAGPTLCSSRYEVTSAAAWTTGSPLLGIAEAVNSCNFAQARRETCNRATSKDEIDRSSSFARPPPSSAQKLLSHRA